MLRFHVYHSDRSRKQLRHVRDAERRKGKQFQVGSTIQHNTGIFKQELSKETPGFRSSLKDAVACDLGGAMRLGTEQGSRWRNVPFFPASLLSFFSASF